MFLRFNHAVAKTCAETQQHTPVYICSYFLLQEPPSKLHYRLLQQYHVANKFLSFADCVFLYFQILIKSWVVHDRRLVPIVSDATISQHHKFVYYVYELHILCICRDPHKHFSFIEKIVQVPWEKIFLNDSLSNFVPIWRCPTRS